MKLLNNKFFLFSIVIVVVAAVIYITQLPGADKTRVADGPGQDGPCDTKSTPRYCSLRSDILKLGRDPWDRFHYAGIRILISDYEKSGLIKSNEKKELDNLLSSKYLAVLGGALKEHCRTTTSFSAATIATFEKELTDLPASTDLVATKNSFSSLLSNFRLAVNTTSNIDSYVYSKPYNAGSNSRYLSEMSGFESIDIIRSNPMLVAAFKRCREELEALAKLEKVVKALCETPELLTSSLPSELPDMYSINKKANKYYQTKVTDIKKGVPCKN